jgi:hypothetical protein
METPRPVTSGPAEFPRSSQTSFLSLPSCTGTHGSRNALLLVSFVTSTTHTAERRLPQKRRDASPCPFQDPNGKLLAHFARSRVRVRPPAPIVPNGGCASNPSFPLPDLSIAVLVASCAARSPLRATPASASLFRDLLTAVAPSKGVSIFCFVILFARSSLHQTTSKGA